MPVLRPAGNAWTVWENSERRAEKALYGLSPFEAVETAAERELKRQDPHDLLAP